MRSASAPELPGAEAQETLWHRLPWPYIWQMPRAAAWHMDGLAAMRSQNSWCYGARLCDALCAGGRGAGAEYCWACGQAPLTRLVPRVQVTVRLYQAALAGTGAACISSVQPYRHAFFL